MERNVSSSRQVTVPRQLWERIRDGERVVVFRGVDREGEVWVMTPRGFGERSLEVNLDVVDGYGEDKGVLFNEVLISGFVRAEVLKIPRQRVEGDPTYTAILNYNLQRFQKYERGDEEDSIILTPRGEVSIRRLVMMEFKTLQVMVGNLLEGLKGLPDNPTAKNLGPLIDNLRTVNTCEESLIDPHTFIVQMAINRGLRRIEAVEGDLRWYYLYTQLSTMLELAGDLLQTLAKDIAHHCFGRTDFMEISQPQYRVEVEVNDDVRDKVSQVKAVSQWLIPALENVGERLKHAEECFKDLDRGRGGRIVAFERWREREDYLRSFAEQVSGCISEAEDGKVIGARLLSLIGAILWVVESILTNILQFSTAPKVEGG